MNNLINKINDGAPSLHRGLQIGRSSWKRLLLPEVELQLLIGLNDHSKEPLVLENERVLHAVDNLPAVVVAVTADSRNLARVDHVVAGQLETLVRVLTDGVEHLNCRSNLNAHGSGCTADGVNDVGITVVGAVTLVIHHKSGARSENGQRPFGIDIFGLIDDRIVLKLKEAVVWAIAQILVLCHDAIPPFDSSTMANTVKCSDYSGNIKYIIQ